MELCGHFVSYYKQGEFEAGDVSEGGTSIGLNDGHSYSKFGEIVNGYHQESHAD